MCLIELVSNTPVTNLTFIRNLEEEPGVMQTKVEQGLSDWYIKAEKPFNGFRCFITPPAGPCHVICVYGKNESGVFSGMAMAHFSSKLIDAVQGCQEKLKELGCKSFETYVVGGNPETKEEARALKDNFESLFGGDNNKLLGFVSPVNKEGEFIDVRMYEDHISFNKSK